MLNFSYIDSSRLAKLGINRGEISPVSSHFLYLYGEMLRAYFQERNELYYFTVVGYTCALCGKERVLTPSWQETW